MVRLVTTLCLLLLVTTSAIAAEVRSLKVDRKRGHIFVKSETYFNAPPADVFNILADYDGFKRISKVFTETRYIERDEIGNGKVYTMAKGCVLFFCTEMERVEMISVEPFNKITATAIPEQSDVDYSVAHWLIEPEGEGTRVRYGLEFKPSFWVPPLIGPIILRKKLRKRGAEAANRIEVLANANANANANASPITRVTP